MLHICNNYISSKAHAGLIKSLSYYESQVVFVPVRREQDVGVNDITCSRISIVYLRYPDFIKYFPLIKVCLISILVIRAMRKYSIAIDKFKNENVLAHNLWSDGVPAYFCSILMKFNYSLVVRNTDINYFIPKLFHARPLIKLVVRKSRSLIFVSEAYHRRFQKKWPNIINCARKILVVPNGVESFWLEQPESIGLNHHDYRECGVIYVGKFNENKNIGGLFSAVKSLNRKMPCKLTLIGGSLDQVRALCGIEGRLPDWLQVKEWVSSDSELVKEFSKHRVFAMPSFKETFGLVFVEALCCGCSIVHSKNEGIDGFFEEEFIQSVDPASVDDIEQALAKLLEGFPSGIGKDTARKVTQRFDWNEIAKEYLDSFK